MLLGSLPVDLVADLGQGELSLVVGAGGDLDVVVSSVDVSALDDLAVDGLDVSLPGVEVGGAEDAQVVVGLVGVSEFADVGLGEAVELAEDEVLVVLQVLDDGRGDLIELAEIFVKGFSGEADLEVDSVGDLGAGGGGGVVDVVEGAVDVVLD